MLVRALPDCIRSDLPDHQIGLLGDDVGIEPLQLDRRFLAADSLVDHGDRSVRIVGLKKRQQALRIRLDMASPAVDDEPIATILASSSEALRKVSQAVLERNRHNRDL